jgi:hypothetical protein
MTTDTREATALALSELGVFPDLRIALSDEVSDRHI